MFSVPVDHPEYRYAPSKNPYWTKLKSFSEIVLADNAPELHKSQWRQKFATALSPSSSPTSINDLKLNVEIGCNAGHVILEWAARDPKQAYIGIDWKFKSIHRAAEKALGRNLKNINFLRAHAERLTYMFGPQEIDTLHLFFPDPWPKKSQWKNRFVNEARLKEIAKLMKPDGVFHIKTDHPGYFEWILEAVSKCTDEWETVQMTRDLHAGHPNPRLLKSPEVTLFESLFIKDGIPIQSLVLKPKQKTN